jgi:hypothetical protein
VDGYSNMAPRVGWLNGRSVLGAPTDRLTAERLAGVLSLLDSTTAAGPTKRLFRPPPQKESVAEPSRHSGALAISFGGPVPTISAPTISAPAVSMAGRHRRPSSPKLSVMGFAFMSRRLALIGVLPLLVVVSAVLFALS